MPEGYSRVCFAAMLWGSKDQGRFILEALMCGAHLQSNSDKAIRRIMYVCPDIAEYPGTKLLSLVWEVRRCQHLQTNSAMDQSAHPRLSNVWSKLQLVKLLAKDFDLAVIIDTDTMAVQCMNELFWYQAPAAVWRGTKTILSGQKRDERSYGTPGGKGGDRPLGGINGGLVLVRPSRQEFKEMLRHLETYAGCGMGAEQDFLTDFWKTRKGIVGLPRRYNCQLHQIGLLGPEAPEDSVYWAMVSHHREEVANWHFSADPKPVDMLWGSIAFPALETGSGSRRIGSGVPITSDVLAAATMTAEPQRIVYGRVVLTSRGRVPGKGKGKSQNLIERGPVRTEHAAPWRHNLTVATLQVEMNNRSAKWRDADPTEERRQEINHVCCRSGSRRGTSAWWNLGA